MPRKSKKQLEEEAKMKAATDESTKVVDEPVKEEGQQEEPVVEQPTEEGDNTDDRLLMDVSDYGSDMSEAETFVKTAVMFYLENKSKVFVEEDTVKKDSFGYDEIVKKIEEFKKSTKFNQYIPKGTVDKFLNSLK